MDIPFWFWLIWVGAFGQSLGGFYFARRGDKEKVPIQNYILPLLLTSVLHGLSVALLIGSYVLGVQSLLLGVLILVLSFASMKEVARRIR